MPEFLREMAPLLLDQNSIFHYWKTYSISLCLSSLQEAIAAVAPNCLPHAHTTSLSLELLVYPHLDLYVLLFMQLPVFWDLLCKSQLFQQPETLTSSSSSQRYFFSPWASTCTAMKSDHVPRRKPGDVLCSPSRKDRTPELPVAQCLKTIGSYTSSFYTLFTGGGQVMDKHRWEFSIQL